MALYILAFLAGAMFGGAVGALLMAALIVAKCDDELELRALRASEIDDYEHLLMQKNTPTIGVKRSHERRANNRE
jgi:hypothetical protein